MVFYAFAAPLYVFILPFHLLFLLQISAYLEDEHGKSYPK